MSSRMRFLALVAILLLAACSAEPEPDPPPFKAKSSKSSTSKTEPPPAASSSSTAPALPPIELAISDLSFKVVTNGFGEPERNKSNGGDKPDDGRAMILSKIAYAKGVGVHAPSLLEIDLNGGYTKFLAQVGVDDEVGAQGSVVFQVGTDNDELLFDSGLMKGGEPSKTIAVDVTGKKKLFLQVTDGGDNFAFDHADWADARLVK